MKNSNYPIRLETTEEGRFLRAEELVKRIAKAKGAGETSNLDLCYILKEGEKARVKFDKYYIPMPVKRIEITSAVNPETVNSLIKLLYD